MSKLSQFIEVLAENPIIEELVPRLIYSKFFIYESVRVNDLYFNNSYVNRIYLSEHMNRVYIHSMLHLLLNDELYDTIISNFFDYFIMYFNEDHYNTHYDVTKKSFFHIDILLTTGKYSRLNQYKTLDILMHKEILNRNMLDYSDSSFLNLLDSTQKTPVDYYNMY